MVDERTEVVLGYLACSLQSWDERLGLDLVSCPDVKISRL